MGDLARSAGPVEEGEVGGLGLSSISAPGRFAAQNKKARVRLEDQGMFVMDALADTPLQRATTLPRSFPKMLSRSMNAITNVIAERGSDAGPGQSLSAVLLHQLAHV